MDISTDRVQIYKEFCNSHNKTLIDIKGGTYKEGNVVHVIAQTNNYNEGEAKKIGIQLNKYKKELEQITKAEIVFNDFRYFRASYFDKTFITVFFQAHRKSLAKAPEFIGKTDLNQRLVNLESESFNDMFIQYLVNLRTEYLNEKNIWDTRKNKEAKKRADELNEWFKHLENTLKKIFNKDDLVLEYEHKKLNFYIQYDDKKFYLDELSDGYSALISILSELILRMELEGIRAKYDIQGLVFIDEIETHLHVDLQKQVLPFLCEFFPNIQFIVTTHSPFVISSINNAVVFDMEVKQRLENLSAYSYEALIEGYFNVDKFSEVVKTEFKEFKTLVDKRKTQKLTKDEILRLNKLEQYFKSIPSYNNEELKYSIDEVLKDLDNGIF